MRIVSLAGWGLHVGSETEAAGWIVDQIGSRGAPWLVLHANVHNFLALKNQAGGRASLPLQTSLLFDGVGMKLGAWLMGSGWLPDNNGTDLYLLVMDRLAASGEGVYFLGADASVLDAAVANACARFPGLHIVGSHPGYFDDGAQERIMDDIGRSGAGLVLVSRGSPPRTDFLIKLRDRAGVAVVWDVGGLFNFVSGRRRRAPTLLRRLRLEWLDRLVREPRRLWRRTVVDVPRFLTWVVRSRFGAGARRSAS